MELERAETSGGGVRRPETGRRTGDDESDLTARDGQRGTE